MVDIEAGLKYPTRGDDSLELHAIGGGLPVLLNVVMGVVAIAGFAVQPLWLLLVPLVPMQLAVSVLWTGYFVRVARDTLAGGTEPPAFDDWGGLTRDGTWGFVVVLAYQVPAFVITLVGYGLAILLLFGASFGARSGSGSLAATSGLVGGVVVLLVFAIVMAYSLAAAYLMPISLVAYADRGSVSAAFSLDVLKRVGLSSAYAEPWAAAIGAYFLVGTVVSFLTSFLVGFLLLPFLPLAYFYIATAGFHMFGQAYAERTGMTIPKMGTAEESAGTGSTGGPERHRPDDV